MTPDEYIRTRLDDQIAWYDRKSKTAKRASGILRTIEVCAAAIIPFAVAYAGNENPEVTFLVGALGVLVACIAGLLGVFQFEAIWVHYRATSEALKREKLLFLTGTAPYDGDTGLPLLVQRVEAVVSEETSDWAEDAMAGRRTL